MNVSSLGARLKALRNERKLSQQELADQLNNKYDTKINKGMISKWENDKELPRTEYVRNLCTYFNVSMDYLICVSDNPTSNQAYEIQTIAAHHEGDEWTEEELAEIEWFKEFVKSKRENK